MVQDCKKKEIIKRTNVQELCKVPGVSNSSSRRVADVPDCFEVTSALSFKTRVDRLPDCTVRTDSSSHSSPSATPAELLAASTVG